MRIPIQAVALSLSLCALGCRHVSTAPDPRAGIDAALSHYARSLLNAPVDSVAASFTPEGELIIPGLPPVKGRDAIRTFLSPLSAATNVVSVEMLSDSLAIAEPAAEQAGTYRQVAGPKAGPTQEYRGRYHATWHHDADGEWRLVRLVMKPNGM